MSTCISRAGEYSAHETEPGNYICDRCGVLDEEGIFAELDTLRAKVAADNPASVAQDATDATETPARTPGGSEDAEARTEAQGDVWAEARAERERAHAKHGDKSMESAPWTSERRLRILLEEVGEVAKEFNDADIDERPVDHAALRAELIQVAAMAGAWADVCPPPHPCGHYVIERGCGGCDPGAVEFIRDDGSDHWVKVDAERESATGPDMTNLEAELAALRAEVERLHKVNEGWCYSCGDLATGDDVAPIVYSLRAQVEQAERHWKQWMDRALTAETELTGLRAEVDAWHDAYIRLAALAEQWDGMADANEDTHRAAANVMRINAADLRAALKGA